MFNLILGFLISSDLLDQLSSKLWILESIDESFLTFLQASNSIVHLLSAIYARNYTQAHVARAWWSEHP
jgi:hypothetical protein